jgi:hypothetical protein
VTRRAVVTQAQIERGLRAARAAMPEQPWRIRITPAEVTIEPQPAQDQQGSPPAPQLDEGEDVVL